MTTSNLDYANQTARDLLDGKDVDGDQLAYAAGLGVKALIDQLKDPNADAEVKQNAEALLRLVVLCVTGQATYGDVLHELADLINANPGDGSAGDSDNDPLAGIVSQPPPPPASVTPPSPSSNSTNGGGTQAVPKPGPPPGGKGRRGQRH